MSPPFFNQVFTPARSPIPTRQLYDALPADLDLTKPFATEVPGTRRAGQTGHYRSTIWPDKSVLLQHPKPQELYTLVKQVTDEIPDDNALGYLPIISAKGERPLRYADEYKWITYGEVETTRMEVGSALIHLFRSGVLGTPYQIDPSSGPDAGWGVGIWAGNRPEWQMTDMACSAFSLIPVALYDTLGPQATEYVANHATLPVIFTSLAHLPSLLKLIPNIPTVKAIVCYENLEGSEGEMARSWAKESGVWIADWNELRGIGRQNLIGPIIPKPTTIATLSYTSGTTGNPKGVVLTHGAMAVSVVTNTYGSTMPERGCVTASYLPLSHVYARFVDLVAVYIRGCVAYSTGDTTRLLADLALMRPHTFCSVPRVLNRIYAAIMAQANSGGLKGNLLKHAINTKIANFRATGVYTHPMYDRIVFSKLQALLGGRVVFMSSGSAPISPDVFETLKVCFCVEFVEGYGLTESVGTGSTGNKNDPGATGKIGFPKPCNEFKLVDVAEMGYTSTDAPFARGELCMKGLNIMQGYYKDEKNTAEAIDSEGWFHTGDICTVDPQGRFKIIDRKKNIMKLAQGEYIALETLEGVYGLCPLFSTFFLHGDGLKTHPVGVGVVDPVQMLGWLHKTLPGLSAAGIRDEAGLRAVVEGKEMTKEGKKVRKEVVKVLRKMARERGLQGFEHCKGIHLTMDPFPEHLLTPTFKFKRNIVAQHFKKELEAAYDEAEEPLEQGDGVKAKL